MQRHLYYITGTSSGIGRALAEACLADGHRVIGIARGSGPDHTAYTHISLDLSREDVLQSFSFGEPDAEDGVYSRVVLINNAGTIDPVKYLGEAGADPLIRAYMLNLVAPAVLTDRFIDAFRHYTAEKLIIHISSGAAQRPVDGWAAYCSSKAGLDMLARVGALEREKAKTGFVHVSIAPGIVDTEIQAQIRTTDPQNFSRREEFVQYKEGGMLVTPAEAARKILKSVTNTQQIRDEVYSVKG